MDNKGKTPLDLAFDNNHNKILNSEKKFTITLYQEKQENKQTPVRVKDFKFINQLGAGAFGTVFLVERESKRYAMKVMRKRTFQGLLNFVMTEKEVQRKINHRYVVKLRYAFQTFDKLYLVTDFCPGGDLRSLVSSKGKVPEKEAVIYIAEILLAIEELHKNGVIHRDIKLDNILLDEKGHAKLTDFGLSKEGMFEKKLTATVLGGGASY